MSSRLVVSGKATQPVVVSPSRIRRQDIQGLRAVAVIMVVAFHAGLPVPGGFVGVDVFFVISGFVITAMLHREWTKTGRIRFGQFYIRRFKRLTPALALMIGATMLISTVVLSPLGTQQTGAKTAIGAMLLAANLVIARTTGGYFDAPAATNALLNTWSLSVEEQFYLVFPAIIALGWLTARRGRLFKYTAYLFVGTIAAVSFGLSVLTSTGWTIGPYWLLGFYSPFTRAWEFALGALLSLGFTKLGVTSRNSAQTVGLLGAAMLAGSLWLISGTTPFPGVWTLLPVAGTLLLLAAGTNSPNTVTRALATRPMVKIGDWSYSIYLWHWPLIVFAVHLWPGNPAAVLAAAGLSLVPALASFRWVEQPIRNLKMLGRPRLARIVAATLAPPLVITGALWFANQNAYWSPMIGSYQTAALQSHAAAVAGCSIQNLMSQQSPGTCQWNARAAGIPIYLVGDSTADHFSEAVVGASDLLHRPLGIVNLTSCPFKDVYLSSPIAVPSRDPRGCRPAYEDTIQWLRQQPPGLVIISELNSWHRQPSTAFGSRADTTTLDPALKTQILEDGLIATVKDLQNVGHSVLLVQAAPDFEDPYAFDPLKCSLGDLLAGTCGTEMPRTVADSIQHVERSSLGRVASATGARIFDPRDFFCSGGTCVTERGGVVLYRDAFHISVEASRQLAPAFAKAIGSAQ